MSFLSCVMLNVVKTVGLNAKIGKIEIVHTRKTFFLVFTCNRIKICISKFRDFGIPGLQNAQSRNPGIEKMVRDSMP